MRIIVVALVAFTSVAFAGGADEATSTPSVVGQIVQGLADSKIDELTSKTYRDDGKEYSYHLTIIDYLGTVQRDGRCYFIASAKYIRSTAKGSKYPPARGHGFLLMFDGDYRIVTYGRLDYGDYYMEGDVVKTGDTAIVDFGTTDPLTRYHGWMLDSAFMPYPFADKISDADWKSGTFRQKP